MLTKINKMNSTENSNSKAKEVASLFLTETEIASFKELIDVEFLSFVIEKELKDKSIGEYFNPEKVASLLKEVREKGSDAIFRNTGSFAKSIRRLLVLTFKSLSEKHHLGCFRRELAGIVISACQKNGFTEKQSKDLAHHVYKEFSPFRLGKNKEKNDRKLILKNISFESLIPWIEELKKEDGGEVANILREVILIAYDFYYGAWKGLDEQYVDTLVGIVRKSYEKNSKIFTSQQCLDISKKELTGIMF